MDIPTVEINSIIYYKIRSHANPVFLMSEILGKDNFMLMSKYADLTYQSDELFHSLAEEYSLVIDVLWFEEQLMTRKYEAVRPNNFIRVFYDGFYHLISTEPKKLDWADMAEERLDINIYSNYEYFCSLFASVNDFENPYEILVMVPKRNYASYQQFLKQLIHNYKITLHNVTVRSICKQNNCKELKEELMDFLDFVDEEDNVYELTFAKKHKYKKLKGIAREKILFISDPADEKDFHPFRLSPQTIDVINNFQDIIRRIMKNFEDVYAEHIDTSDLEYTLPDLKEMGVDLLAVKDFRITEEEKEAFDYCVEHFRNILDNIKFTTKLGCHSTMTPNDIDKTVLSIIELKENIGKFPKSESPKSSFHLPPLLDMTRTTKKEPLNLDYLAFFEDCWTGALKLDTMVNNKVKCKSHLEFAKIDYVKEKRMMKTSEVPKETSLPMDYDCRSLDILLDYLHTAKQPKFQSNQDFNKVRVLGSATIGIQKYNLVANKYESALHYLGNLKSSDYMYFVSQVFNCILHHNEKTEKDDILIDNAGYKDLLIFMGHGSSIIQRRMSRPFCFLLKTTDEIQLRKLYPIDRQVAGVDCTYVLTKWMRMPMSFIEHYSNAYEKYMLSCILPVVHEDSTTSSVDALKEESIVKLPVILNNKKKLQQLLDNVKYLYMGSMAIYSNIGKFINDKLNVPIKDVVYCRYLNLITKNLVKVYKAQVMPRKPKYTGTVRVDSTRGGEFEFPSIYGKRNCTNMYNLLDNFYLSHLTTKDANTSYHDKFEALTGIAEWEKKYKEFVSIDPDYRRSLDYLKDLLNSTENKIQFHPLIISYSIKRCISENKIYNKIKEDIDKIRLDLSLSDVCNTSSMIYERIKEGDFKMNAYTIKSKFFELRAKSHDIIVEAMANGKMTLTDFLKEMYDNSPYFNLTNKVQFGTGREIYIQDLRTRLSNFYVELVYSVFAKHIKEESISKKGEDKIRYMDSLIDKHAQLEGTLIYENRDCSKWSLGSTLEEYEVMTDAVSEILGATNYTLMSKFIQNMKLKMIEIPHDIWRVWERDYFDPDKLNEHMRTIYDEAKLTKLFHLESNWLMGMFNYMSSVKACAKMYFVKDLLKELNFLPELSHMEHSDDEFILYNLTKGMMIKCDGQYKAIKFIDEVIDFAHKAVDSRNSDKKSQVQMILAEFVSSFNFNGHFTDPPINFYSAVTQPVNHDGWASDMENYVGRIIEYVRRCGYIEDIPFMLHLTKTKMNNMYRFGKGQANDIEATFGLQQEYIPVGLGGVPNCDPLGLFFGGIPFHYSCLINANNPRTNFMLNKLQSLESDSLEFNGFGTMKFMHGFKKFKMGPKSNLDIPDKYELIPKTKSATLEYRRLMNDYLSPSFMKAYTDQNAVTNMIKLATFIRNDMIFNDVGVENSNLEHSYWRGNRGYKKFKSCTIMDYWGAFIGENKDYDYKRDYLKYDVKLNQLHYFMRNAKLKEIVNSDHYTYKSLKVQPNLLETTNTLNVLMLHKYRYDLFKILNDTNPETINRNALKKEAVIFDSFTKNLDYEQVFKIIPYISNMNKTYRSDAYSVNFIDAMISALKYYWSSDHSYISHLEGYFSFKHPITNQELIQIERSKFTTSIGSQIIYALNLFSLTLMTDLNFNNSAACLSLDMDYLVTLNYEDILKSGIDARTIRNWIILCKRIGGSKGLLQEAYKDGLYGHKFINRDDKKIIQAYYGRNKAEIEMGGGFKILYLDILSTKNLYKLLYYIEGLAGLTIIQMERIEELNNYKSKFLEPNTQNYTSRNYIYYREGTKYTNQTSDQILNFKAKGINIFNEVIEEMDLNKLAVKEDSIYYGSTEIFKYNHKLTANNFRVLESDISYWGIKLHKLLSNDFISAFKTNRYLDMRFSEENLGKLFNRTTETDYFIKNFAELICESKLSALINHPEFKKITNPKLLDLLKNYDSGGFEEKKEEMSAEMKEWHAKMNRYRQEEIDDYTKYKNTFITLIEEEENKIMRFGMIKREKLELLERIEGNVGEDELRKELDDINEKIKESEDRLKDLKEQEEEFLPDYHKSMNALLSKDWDMYIRQKFPHMNPDVKKVKSLFDDDFDVTENLDTGFENDDLPAAPRRPDSGFGSISSSKPSSPVPPVRRPDSGFDSITSSKPNSPVPPVRRPASGFDSITSSKPSSPVPIRRPASGFDSITSSKPSSPVHVRRPASGFDSISSTKPNTPEPISVRRPESGFESISSTPEPISVRRPESGFESISSTPEPVQIPNPPEFDENWKSIESLKQDLTIKERHLRDVEESLKYETTELNRMKEELDNIIISMPEVEEPTDMDAINRLIADAKVMPVGLGDREEEADIFRRRLTSESRADREDAARILRMYEDEAREDILNQLYQMRAQADVRNRKIRADKVLRSDLTVKKLALEKLIQERTSKRAIMTYDKVNLMGLVEDRKKEIIEREEKMKIYKEKAAQAARVPSPTIPDYEPVRFPTPVIPVPNKPIPAENMPIPAESMAIPVKPFDPIIIHEEDLDVEGFTSNERFMAGIDERYKDLVRKAGLKTTELSSIYQPPFSIENMPIYYREGFVNIFMDMHDEEDFPNYNDKRKLEDFLTKLIKKDLTPVIYNNDIPNFLSLFKQLFAAACRLDNLDFRELLKYNKYFDHITGYVLPEYLENESELTDDNINELLGLVRKPIPAPQKKAPPKNKFGIAKYRK